MENDMAQNETRTVVECYFEAWTTNRVDDAYSLLAEDLEFRGPTANYQGAAAFRPALVAFAAMAQRARLVELIIEGNRAAMLYECDLPQPVGTLRIGSFFRVEQGKISWYETQFDATELRKVLAAKRA